MVEMTAIIDVSDALWIIYIDRIVMLNEKLRSLLYIHGHTFWPCA